jgi:undecaprenyl-diphosphatase
VTVVLLRALPGRGSRLALMSAAIAIAVTIGLTRIELRTHYFSDVAGGLGLGATMFALSAMVALIVSYIRQNPSSSP